MITFKPIIIQGGRRRDGTWPVKIRITFRGVVRRLPTTLVCTDADLTRSGRIKNATILEKAGELIARMRAACDTLSPFTLEEWSVDDVVAHIRTQLTARSFRLDFFTFADSILEDKIPHTRNYYVTALNALERFIGRRQLDVNAITRGMLMDFVEFIGSEAKAARHLAKLSYIHKAARLRYNDEDSGLIAIPRQPFRDLPRIRPVGRAQKALPVEVVQRAINARPENGMEAVALAALVVSFGTMGANLADLYDAKPLQGDIWHYHRHKTGTEAKVKINGVLRGFLRVLGEGSSAEWWLPELHRWGTPDTATHNVNKWLRRWAVREGLEPFTFYAGRKAWGTTARRLGVEKATVDEGLAHKGDYKLTDIYAERNWSLAWAANDLVLAEFSWD